MNDGELGVDETVGTRRVRHRTGAPLTVVVASVGLGGGTENDLADIAEGHSGPLPSEARR